MKIQIIIYLAIISHNLINGAKWYDSAVSKNYTSEIRTPHASTDKNLNNGNEQGNGREKWMPKDCTVPLRCPKKRTYSMLSDLRKPCMCDEDCHIYGDCCVDPPRVDKSDFPSFIQHNPKLWSCKELYSASSAFSQTVYMIGWCPEGTSEHLKSRCEQKILGDQKYTHLMDIPIISNSSNLIFSNIFCAKCHSQSVAIVKYDFTIDCKIKITNTSDLQNMVYHQGQRKWTKKNENECYFDVKYPAGIGRWCELNLIETCSDGSPCPNTNYHLYDNITGLAYKNYECAICNQASESDLHCPSSMKMPLFAPRSFVPPSLVDLFRSDQGCGTDNEEKVFDPVFARYENMYCGHNKYLLYGECVDEDSTPAINILSTVLLSISLLCMFLHNIIFLLIPKRRNPPNFDTFSMTSALFMAELSFIATFDSVENHKLCYFFAIVTYYFFFSSFFWTNIISASLYKTFATKLQRRRSNKKQILLHSLYGWGVPIIIVSISIIVDQTVKESAFTPEFATCQCWFNNEYGIILFFTTPMELIMLSNLILFFKTTRAIVRTQNETTFATSSIDKKRKGQGSVTEKEEFVKSKEGSVIVRRTKKNFKDAYESTSELRNRASLNIRIALMMGLTWAFACLSELFINIAFDYLFVIFNGLQGTLIFILFDCKKTVYNDLKQVFNKKSRKDQYSGSTKFYSYNTTSIQLDESKRQSKI